jgi:simple sugar transport system ATP-binding protein
MTTAEALSRPHSPTPAEPALEACQITRRFPGVVANDRVDFEVLPGEIHALLGENGSGKTTLCKVFTGLYRPDEGHVRVNGEPVEFRSPRDAFGAGIFMVQQHFSLVERLTVAENVVLGWSRRQRFRFSRRDVEREVAAAADEFSMHIDPRAYVWQLSLGEQQRVEILKALYRSARTLILDEPTTVLSPQECDALFVTLRKLAASGGSIIFISHKLDEVLAVANRVTVLRKGKGVGTFAVDDTIDARELARRMVGREVSYARRADQAPATQGDVVLEVTDVAAEGDLRPEALKGVSLTLRRGEILGVAGVAGNGQLELAEAIAGVRARSTGSVSVDGKALASGNPRQSIAAGLAYVPEDRRGTGLVTGLDVTENIALKAYRDSEFSFGFFMRRGRMLARAVELIERFDVKGTPATLIRQLSGGNAQKVLLARELSSRPNALVVAEPTQGLDVAATQSVRQLLLDAAAGGVGVLLISEDLDEVLELSDRVAVMFDGRVMGVAQRDELDRDTIGLMMAGVVPGA